MENVSKESKIPNPIAFISKWRSLPPFELISYVFMFAAASMFAYGINSYDRLIYITILFTILSLYSGFFAALIWNDITDFDIDKLSHPDRPIPSGRISSKKFFAIALFFSTTTFIFAYLVNIWCFLLVGFTALFVAFHDKYFKKMVKIPAYSEIFTPLQWIIVPIFGFIAMNNTNYVVLFILVLFTYFADNAHDLADGIHDYTGDLKNGVKTYATSFGKKNAARISFFMFFLSGILGFLLYYSSFLTLIFLIPFVLIWFYAMFYSYKLLKTKEENMSKIGSIVGRKGFNYFLIIYDLIFLDVLVQLLIFYKIISF